LLCERTACLLKYTNSGIKFHYVDKDNLDNIIAVTQ
jgi:hypothetical protein